MGLFSKKKKIGAITFDIEKRSKETLVSISSKTTVAHSNGDFTLKAFIFPELLVRGISLINDEPKIGKSLAKKLTSLIKKVDKIVIRANKGEDIDISNENVALDNSVQIVDNVLDNPNMKFTVTLWDDESATSEPEYDSKLEYIALSALTNHLTSSSTTTCLALVMALKMAWTTGFISDGTVDKIQFIIEIRDYFINSITQIAQSQEAD